MRSGYAVGGEPFIAARGSGAYLYAIDGRRYIDYVMAYGPLLLGHAHPALRAEAEKLAGQGLVYGSTTGAEMLLAERIAVHLPSMEQIRFTTTGTEAVMSAIRVARAFTGRDAILRFAGNYHGHFDAALLDAGASAQTGTSAGTGIPAATMADLFVARYNDLGSVDAALRRCAGRLAAIVVEPVVANMGLVLPEPGFLEGLQARAADCGAVLVFDEIITWLRLGLGGAQALTGVRPDLTTLGKIVGGGAPLAAFGGRADVMGVLAPDGACFTGGTHAGNPFAVGLALRTLEWLETHREVYDTLNARARTLAAGIRTRLAALDLDFAVVQLDSIVDFKFRPGPLTRNFDDALRADAAQFAAFYHALRGRGVLLPPSQNEVMFLSTEHSAADIEETLEAIGAALLELRAAGVV